MHAIYSIDSMTRAQLENLFTMTIDGSTPVNIGLEHLSGYGSQMSGAEIAFELTNVINERFGDGKKFDFSVSDTTSHKLAGCRVSSTAIRQLLENDDLSGAQTMLGRPYSIIGKVFHGDKRGREMGFPTANIKLKRRVSPVSGVYVVQVKSQFGEHYVVANIGS